MASLTIQEDNIYTRLVVEHSVGRYEFFGCSFRQFILAKIEKCKCPVKYEQLHNILEYSDNDY